MNFLHLSCVFKSKLSPAVFSRLALLALTAGCALAAPTRVFAQTDWLNLGLNTQQERHTINFNDVEAIEFINFVSRICNKNFIYDSSQLHFRVTVVSDESSSSEEVLATLLQIMRMNGFTVSEEGSNILLYQGTPTPGLPHVATEFNSRDSGLVTRVFRLRYAAVGDLMQIVTKLATDESRVSSQAATRQIIVCDTVSNVNRIGELLQALDQIDSTQEIDVYKVKHSNLAALKSFAEQIMEPFSSASSATRSSLTIVPNVNANSLFLIGSRQLIDRAIGVLTSLDTPSELEVIARSRESRSLDSTVTDPSKILDPQINPEFYIYKLQYHPGGEILQTLRSIGSGLSSGTAQQALDPPLAMAMQSMQWLESTNSLLFSGDDGTIIKLRNLIQGLDTPVKQVFIEALIIDTTITNANSFSVDLGTTFSYGSQRLGVSLGNFGQTSALPSNITDYQSSLAGDKTGNRYATPVGPSLNPTNFSAGVIGSAVSHGGMSFGTIGSLITAVQTDGDTRIVLNPKILTEDNVACEFFVGQKVRIKSGIVQNSGNNNVTSSNFEISDVGTTLRLTPTISSDDLITLDILQETSTIIDSSNASDQSVVVPLSSTSSTKTRLHVPDRHFVILGGMIDDTKTNSASRVPLLGSIPVLGFLFRANNKTNNRRNLMFFIRPQIITTNEEVRMLTDRYKDIVQQHKTLPKDMDKQSHFSEPVASKKGQ